MLDTKNNSDSRVIMMIAADAELGDASDVDEPTSRLSPRLRNTSTISSVPSISINYLEILPSHTHHTMSSRSMHSSQSHTVCPTRTSSLTLRPLPTTRPSTRGDGYVRAGSAESGASEDEINDMDDRSMLPAMSKSVSSPALNTDRPAPRFSFGLMMGTVRGGWIWMGNVD